MNEWVISIFLFFFVCCSITIIVVFCYLRANKRFSTNKDNCCDQQKRQEINGNCVLQNEIDIETSVPLVTDRTTRSRSLAITAVKPLIEAGSSSNSNSVCQLCFLCRCTGRLELGNCRQLGHLSNFYKATENLPFHCVMWNVLATERLYISGHGAI